jgi:hypothetical protein
MIPPPPSWPLAMAFLFSLAVHGRASPPDDPGLGPGERETLSRYARDTWHSFEAMAMPGGLPADSLQRGDDGAWQPTRSTTPTDIGAYLWSTLAAERLGIIEPAEARRRLDRTLGAIARLERPHGLFLDKLDARTGARLEKSPEGGRPIHPKLAAVDNAWLATALIMVRNTKPGMRDRAEALLKPMDFGFFYDAYDPTDPLKHPGQIRGSFELDTQSFGPPHQLINTEPRIASYIGIVQGQIPPEHYYHVFRALPPDRNQQRQTPAGEWRTYRGVRVFEGHYTYRGMRIVPSWGGSIFEALMVPLFVPEARWAPRSWGVNHPLYVRAQIEHGLDVRRYGLWGFSPASKPEGGYQPYGVNAIGTSPEGYHSHNRQQGGGEQGGAHQGGGEQGGGQQNKGKQQGGGQQQGGRQQGGGQQGQGKQQGGGQQQEPPTGSLPDGVVTPHASFLALPFAPREAMVNLRALEHRYPAIYTPHGFRDSVNLSTGRISDRILALDQGMIMSAIANALADDFMQHAFSDGQVEGVIRPLIAPEEFTAGAGADGGSSPSH